MAMHPKDKKQKLAPGRSRRDPRSFSLVGLPAWAEYWEAPDALSSDGRFPSLFATKAGPLLIWQEAQSSGESGSARIRFARFDVGRVEAGLGLG